MKKAIITIIMALFVLTFLLGAVGLINSNYSEPITFERLTSMVDRFQSYTIPLNLRTINKEVITGDWGIFNFYKDYLNTGIGAFQSFLNIIKLVGNGIWSVIQMIFNTINAI